eukprot:5495134-Pleurochrysis_carterae.AAC.1
MSTQAREKQTYRIRHLCQRPPWRGYRVTGLAAPRHPMLPPSAITVTRLMYRAPRSMDVETFLTAYDESMLAGADHSPPRPGIGGRCEVLRRLAASPSGDSMDLGGVVAGAAARAPAQEEGLASLGRRLLQAPREGGRDCRQERAHDAAGVQSMAQEVGDVGSDDVRHGVQGVGADGDGRAAAAAELRVRGLGAVSREGCCCRGAKGDGCAALPAEPWPADVGGQRRPIGGDGGGAAAGSTGA